MDDMLQNMLINTNDAISLESLENDRDVSARPLNSWNRLEFYINPGHSWARHGRPKWTSPKGGGSPSLCVCVCVVLVTKKKTVVIGGPSSIHEGSWGITRDHEKWRVSEGLRQLYTFFAAWCDALGKRFIDLRPTLRCGVVSKEIKATRKTYLAEGVSQVILICFQLRWEISTVVDPCVRTQTGHP